ncbi:MAG: hypothetical protein KAU95_01705 [Candidatus Aenigmarchaeota archaeon]|nr:hypothetical protein [Candidatus Aenigmarchaeota archaeon]
MKGITEGIFGYIVIVLAVISLAIFLISQSGMKGIEVEKRAGLRIFRESGNLAINSLFNYKVDFVEKPYIETIIDAILEAKADGKLDDDSDKVFYGIGIGTLNNTEIIPPLFDNYMPGRWKLTVITPDGEFTYGNFSGEPEYVYEQLIPVPEERLGRIILYIK